MVKLTGPGGEDEVRRGESPGGAGDSGVASGDECPMPSRDPFMTTLSTPHDDLLHPIPRRVTFQ